MLEAVVFIKNYYGYYNQLSLRSNWFERFGLGLLQYKKIIDERIDVDKVTFTFEATDESEDLTDEVDCLIALPIVLDRKCFVSLIAFYGPPDVLEGAKYQMTSSGMSVIYKTYFTIESLASGEAMKELEGVMNSYESPRTVIPFLNQFMDEVVANAKLAAEEASSGDGSPALPDPSESGKFD